jgi:dihydroneopterin aldolase
MILAESTISLNDVRLYAYHGVMEQERRVGGEYSVSLRVHYNISKAMKTDDVADTLNYAELLEIVKGEMAKPSKLLEHVAGRIGEAVFRQFPQTEAIELTVTKLNPPMGVDSAGASVSVHLINK